MPRIADMGFQLVRICLLRGLRSPIRQNRAARVAHGRYLVPLNRAYLLITSQFPSPAFGNCDPKIEERDATQGMRQNTQSARALRFFPHAGSQRVVL